MLLAALAALLRLRPVFATDLLELPAEIRHWAFEKLGTHAGAHQLCPGWCPCDAFDDLDAQLELDEQLADALAA